jgi:V-type H+-transporting ATPase subunit F
MNFVSIAFRPTSILAIIVFGWLWDAREKVPQSLASTKAALRLKFVKRLPRPKALRFVGFSFTTQMGKAVSFAPGRAARAPMPPKKVDGAKIGALIAVIGDEETVTGMLLAGVGDKERGGRSNFMVVDPSKTTPAQIQEAFHNFTKRPDVAVLVINQYIASTIRETVDSFEGKSPAILEIPSKEHPYDPSQDAVHRRTKLLLGIRD